MVELPTLNDDQRLYLKTIFDYFHVEGKWPTYLWVETTFLQMYPEKRSEFDLAEMCKGLPDNFATGFSFNHQYSQEAAFIAPVLYYFPEAKEEMADFIRVVRFCVEKINAPVEERPELLSEDLNSQLHMQPLAIRKMGLLLQSEPNIFNGSNANELEGWWRIGLKRGKYGVRHFEGVATFEQYLEKRIGLTRYFSGNVAVQQVQSEPAIFVPASHMGTVGTQYHHSHIVQGDYYNISGNAGDVKIKSPSTETKATKDEHSSPWVSGSFYLTVLIVVIVALVVVARLLPFYVLPIVFIGGFLAVSIIGGLQLRQDDRLNEDNFLKLMALSFRYLPLVKGQEAKTDKRGISASSSTFATEQQVKSLDGQERKNRQYAEKQPKETIRNALMVELKENIVLLSTTERNLPLISETWSLNKGSIAAFSPSLQEELIKAYSAMKSYNSILEQISKMYLQKMDNNALFPLLAEQNATVLTLVQSVLKLLSQE